MKLPLILLVVIAAASFAAPLVNAILGIDPNVVDLLDRLSGPSLAHPLGTDELGRDVLLRLLAGGRVSLVIGVAAALAAAALGTLIGLTAGYLGGWTDRVLMRGTDAMIALPLLPLLIVLAALDLNKLGLPARLIQSDEISVVRIVALAVLVGWTTAARLVRGAALVTRNRDFVRAARSLGAGVPHILWLHILPNVLAPLIVATTLSVGDVILFESVLSFLGLGVQPPLSSWGSMLSNAQELITAAPLLAVYPGLMIFLTVVACNLLGDALQRRLDPVTARTR
ncbi:MAG: ABC transporter permease [Alphaproteobacteria bacterium]|nr:MAG: ABC transporter permease [Alphaproteobacteria bacterium]